MATKYQTTVYEIYRYALSNRYECTYESNEDGIFISVQEHSYLWAPFKFWFDTNTNTVTVLYDPSFE